MSKPLGSQQVPITSWLSGQNAPGNASRPRPRPAYKKKKGQETDAQRKEPSEDWDSSISEPPVKRFKADTSAGIDNETPVRIRESHPSRSVSKLRD
jgi:hypothetical protein